MQNASFTFPVKVKDDKPVFYYCAVAMHCKMGMFVRRRRPPYLVAQPPS